MVEVADQKLGTAKIQGVTDYKVGFGKMLLIASTLNNQEVVLISHVEEPVSFSSLSKPNAQVEEAFSNI